MRRLAAAGFCIAFAGCSESGVGVTCVPADGRVISVVDPGAWGGLPPGLDATQLVQSSALDVTSVATDGVFAYATVAYLPGEAAGGLLRIPLSGGSATVLASSQPGPVAVAADDAFVYWVDEGSPPDYVDGSVMRVGKDGCGLVELAGPLVFPSDVAVGPEGIYFTTRGSWQLGGTVEGTVARVWPSDGHTDVLARIPIDTAQTPVDVVDDRGDVFWAVAGGYSNGEVWSLSAGVGSPARLAGEQNGGPAAIAVDASNVYLTNPGGHVLRAVPRGGGGVSTLAMEPGSPVAVREGALYYAGAVPSGESGLVALDLASGVASLVAPIGVRDIVADADQLLVVVPILGGKFSERGALLRLAPR